ncbi:hypothetical protein G7068_06860 [Leucobacter viscericola]|uniref:Uncharacterized protein n=1 Tax=Leucobacter viscericola TaxID=2714935 RepID=A0A6G7XEX4_9MICO|nr:hypothetical protein [Leucobacter viscericola]QIK62947.1 hypothetical protein G7068_06860 [Leucobacter viscericola]
MSVSLGSNGKISAVDGSAIYLDEIAGRTSSSATSYVPRDVVNDLPVRVTTRYLAGDKTGENLEDLAGYTGQVEIEVMLENLTVASRDVEFDAAGHSYSAPALVGTPLSVAAAATLKGVDPGELVFDADKDAANTNGVVSVGADGRTVVQWATLLAPPHAEATATLRLVANVTDFAVPDIDIAVQAGLQSDLSFDGVLASAFNNGPNSEIGMQQKAISLVAEVNEVLARAGGTITEVRKNLNDTSGTLGVRAAERLRSSSTSLTEQMSALSEQLTSLEGTLNGSVKSTQSAMTSQLSEIVSSMNSMLGTTTGHPSSYLDGSGCLAKVKTSEASGTLFSTILQLSGLLDGYSKANASCRDQVVEEINALLGPEVPDADACVETSMTCSLFEAKGVISGALMQFVADSQDILDELDGQKVNDAIGLHGQLGTTLSGLEGLITKLDAGVIDESTWNEIDIALGSANSQAASLAALQENAANNRDALKNGGEVDQQQQALAALICSSGIDPVTAEQLRAYLTDTKCDHTPQDPSLIPAEGTFQKQRNDQRAAWDQVVAAIPLKDAPLTQLQDDLAKLGTKLSALKTSVGSPGFQGIKSELRALKDDADEKYDDLGLKLGEIKVNQEHVSDSLTDSLQDHAGEANDTISEDLDERISVVHQRVTRGRDSLVESFNLTIDGLAAASKKVRTEGKTQIDGQKAKLNDAKLKATEALDKQTISALEHIAASTDRSTQNVTAASAMLAESLSKVVLDLGDPKVKGSGILGAMSKSAAQSDTADYQLALASQRASGFANVRSDDIAGLRLRQAQFQASIESVAELPAFHLDIAAGATSQTIYSFHVKGGDK